MVTPHLFKKFLFSGFGNQIAFQNNNQTNDRVNDSNYDRSEPPAILQAEFVKRKQLGRIFQIQFNFLHLSLTGFRGKTIIKRI
jgi:hypothetical protein